MLPHVVRQYPDESPSRCGNVGGWDMQHTRRVLRYLVSCLPTDRRLLRGRDRAHVLVAVVGR